MTHRPAVWTFLGVGLAALSTSCDRKDPEKCQQALSTVRQATAAGQFDSISEWRNYAYKHCSDPGELQKLDQEVVDKKTALEKAKAEKAALELETKNVVKSFIEFVGEHRQDPTRAAAMKCGENEKEKDDVWCSGDRWLNRTKGYKYDVRFWKAEPAAAHFRTRTIGEVGCKDLGSVKLVRKAGDPANFWHCKLHDAGTEGLHAIVERTPKETRIEVFSQAYLAREPALAAKAKP